MNQFVEATKVIKGLCGNLLPPGTYRHVYDYSEQVLRYFLGMPRRKVVT